MNHCFIAHKHRALSLLIISLAIFGQTAEAQQVGELRLDPVMRSTLVYIDESKLGAEKGVIINAVAELSNSLNLTRKVRVNQGETLSTIVKNLFHYDSKNDPSTLVALTSKIAQLNKVDEQSKLIVAGQYLQIPIVPTKPAEKSSKKVSQVLDFTDNQLYLANSKNLVRDELIFSGATSNQASEGRLWALRLDSIGLDLFKKNVNSELYEKLYGKSLIEIADPSFSTVHLPDEGLPTDTNIQNELPESATIPIKAIEKLDSVDKSNFKGFYFLDYFDSELCGHGAKVRDVITETAAKYNKKYSDLNIHEVSISFWDDVSKSMKFIKDYYRDILTSNAITLNKLQIQSDIEKLPTFVKEGAVKEKKSVPDIFLSACFNKVYDLEPDIISTSIYATTYANSNIMPRYRQTNTSLFTAARDSPGAIEDVMAVDGQPGGALGVVQPLFDYFSRHSAIGSVIVGARIGKGRFMGGHSKLGRNVTAIGLGSNWGGGGLNTCIKPADRGTSFATPEIATHLYLAKGYWRSKNFVPDAMESRIRLFLSSDIDTSFTGRFASGGICNLEKLLVLANGFIQFEDNSITPMRVQKNGVIDYDFLNKSPLRRGKDAIQGITLIGNRFYLFKEDELAWRQAVLNGMNIVLITAEDQLEIRGYEDLKSNSIKQIVIFKD